MNLLCCYLFLTIKTRKKNQEKKKIEKNNPKIQEDKHKEAQKIAQVGDEGPKWQVKNLKD